ncbi:hypothetical protein AB6A40_003139 [Gnathostoma spinigerum]|uniref:RYYR-CCHC domain-containing protein n=1 Tax=Gnathostoma spinigerum TaxID=75299 RepID=A0ABD6E8N1_9BILA
MYVLLCRITLIFLNINLYSASDKLEEKNRISSSAKELLRESRDSAKSSPALSTVGNNQVNNDGRNVGDSETVSQCSVIKTLSNRGRYTSLAIRVSDDAVRVYRLSSSREESGTNYYRCSRCECLNKKSDVKFKPRVKTQNGRIIGDAFPSHHHDCQPLPLPKYQAQQLDYSCRADVRDGLAEPKQAWSRGHDIALQKWAAAEESAISKEVIDNFPDWSHVRKAYSRIRRQRHERDSFGHGRTYSCHDE